MKKKIDENKKFNRKNNYDLRHDSSQSNDFVVAAIITTQELRLYFNNMNRAETKPSSQFIDSLFNILLIYLFEKIKHQHFENVEE